jgi:dTDP-glucose pyrophosphorylase
MIQCIIPAAGKGLRFFELGRLYPKCTLPFRHLPLIVHNLNYILTIDSIKLITIIVEKEDTQVLGLMKIFFQDDLSNGRIEVLEYSHDKFGVGPASTIIAGCRDNFDSYLIFLSDIVLVENLEQDLFKNSFLSVKEVALSTRWCVVAELNGSMKFHNKEILEGNQFNALSGIYFFKNGKNFVKSIADLTSEIDTEAFNEVEISRILELYIILGDSFTISPGIKLLDYGTLDEYLANNDVSLSRNFNKISDLGNGFIEKSALHKDFYSKIEFEAQWFTRIPDRLKIYTPIISNIRTVKEQNRNFLSPSYQLEKILYPTLSDFLLYFDRTPEFWNEVISKLQDYFILCIEISPSSPNDFTTQIKSTLQKRWGMLTDEFKRNFDLQELYSIIDGINGFDNDSYFHGDLVLQNIFFDLDSRKLKLIDPNGQLVGNLVYDLAKLFQSLVFGYDFIDKELYFMKDNFVEIYSKDYEEISLLFLSTFISKFGNVIMLDALKLTGILFIQLIPLHEDKFSHQKIYLNIASYIFDLIKSKESVFKIDLDRQFFIKPSLKVREILSSLL